MNKKGISLIVLVITIIVMIVLATSVIITLTSTGAIDKANVAVGLTNAKQVEQLANVAWAEAYANGKRKTEDLKEYVDQVLTNNKIDKSLYLILVDEKGVSVLDKGTKLNNWELVHRTDENGSKVVEVTNGKKSLPVGAYIDYKSGVSTYTDQNGWYLLGAEDGDLLVVSAKAIGTKELNGKQGYINAITTIGDSLSLNDMCLPYADGEIGILARSINAEDIDALLQYDKTEYKKGTVKGYGNVVTYDLNGTTNPGYTYAGLETPGKLTSTHSTKYTWFDVNEETWNEADITETKAEVAQLTSTVYTYDYSSPTDAIRSMLTSASGNFWLATRYIRTDSDHVRYGVYYSGGGTYCQSLVYSYNTEYSLTSNVRAVVKLANHLDFDVLEDGSIKIK